MPFAPAGRLRNLEPLLSGLRFRPADSTAAAAPIIASIISVTLFILLLDGLVFRRWLPAGYVDFYTSPLIPRTFRACLLSSFEEVKFRLILMTLLVMLVSRWRTPVPARAIVAIILISQLANVWVLIVAYPLYASLRFWLVGSVWGWLYWRHGWLAALVGHVSTHVILDPLLAFVLLHTRV